MGRRPLAPLRRRSALRFPVNIVGRVEITLMGHPTLTRPDTVPQGDAGIEGATDMTEFGGREKAVDVMYLRIGLLGCRVQNMHKLGQC